MANKKHTNAYANFSAEAIADALLTVEGWFEQHKRQAEAKQASDLFDVVWGMIEKSPLPPAKKKQEVLYSPCEALLKACKEVVKSEYGCAPSVEYMDSLKMQCAAAIEKYENPKQKEPANGTQHSNNH